MTQESVYIATNVLQIIFVVDIMPILLKQLFEKRVKPLFVCFDLQPIEKNIIFPTYWFVLSLSYYWTLNTISLQIQGDLIKVAEYPRLRWEIEED